MPTPVLTELGYKQTMVIAMNVIIGARLSKITGSSLKIKLNNPKTHTLITVPGAIRNQAYAWGGRLQLRLSLDGVKETYTLDQVYWKLRMSHARHIQQRDCLSQYLSHKAPNQCLEDCLTRRYEIH